MKSFTYRRLTFTPTKQTGYGQYNVEVRNDNFDYLGNFHTDNMVAIDRCNAAEEADVYCKYSATWRKDAQQRARRELYNEFKRKYNM